jgi:hypothetical protein
MAASDEATDHVAEERLAPAQVRRKEFDDEEDPASQRREYRPHAILGARPTCGSW